MFLELAKLPCELVVRRIGNSFPGVVDNINEQLKSALGHSDITSGCFTVDSVVWPTGLGQYGLNLLEFNCTLCRTVDPTVAVTNIVELSKGHIERCLERVAVASPI